MKKIGLVAALILLAVVASAAIRKTMTKIAAYANVGNPQMTVVMTAWGIGQDEARQGVTIAAQSGGKRNCLSFLRAVGTSTMTVRVLDGGTTIYAESTTAGSPAGASFDDEDLCGSVDTALHVTVSTGINQSVLDRHLLNFSRYSY